MIHQSVMLVMTYTWKFLDFVLLIWGHRSKPKGQPMVRADITIDLVIAYQRFNCYICLVGL